jgi:hypothetical protein
MKISLALMQVSNALCLSHNMMVPNKIPTMLGSAFRIIPRKHSNGRHLRASIIKPLQMGKPKSGSIVDSYQTVSVNCMKCRTRLFRYKKKNGTKSNLIKCYVERISEDCVDLVKTKDENSTEWHCPSCETRFGKDSMIHGRPAIKLVGGKTQMTKK